MSVHLATLSAPGRTAWSAAQTCHKPSWFTSLRFCLYRTQMAPGHGPTRKVPAWARDAGMAVPDARDLRLAIKVPKMDDEIEVLDSTG